MEVSVEMEIAARGCPRKADKLIVEKEKNKEALDIDPYAVAWMLKRKNKLIYTRYCPRRTT